jgi:formylglycine-generating enzyme required for sulfatase activity
MTAPSDWVLATEESGYSRHFDATALPVSIGGDEGNDLVLADVSGSLQIGRLDDVFFVQPGRATENLRLDGELLRGSKRLEDGSVIALDTARLSCRISEGRLRLSIEAQVTAGDTAPPDFEALAQDQSREMTVSPIAFHANVDRGVDDDARRISKTSLVVYAAFVVLAMLGWFAFTAKSVRIETMPSAENMELPGTWFKFRIGDRFLLRRGEHRIVADLPGYYPIDEAFEVDGRPDQSVSFEFVRLPGLISFATDPEAAAEVRLDGELIGTTPITDFEVRPGTHQVQFTAERYLTELVSLDVEGGHERDSVTAELTPSWAPVSLTSKPAGAEVRVDGRVLGETPAELELTAGDRQIEVALAGYNSWRRQIRVVADEPQSLPEVVLAPADGHLALDTTPVDASINIDGQYLGRTPRDLSLSPNVEHKVTISKPGYETETLELTFDPGAHKSVDLDLVELMGVVEVTSEPAGAEVLINGETAGRTPLTIELQAVEQHVAVHADGFAGAEQTITPRPGYPQNLPFELTPLDQSTGGGYPRVVMTGLGQRLRLIPAGRFEMGTSRGEENWRQNEVLHAVELTHAFYLAEKEMTNAEFRHCDPDHDSGSFAGQSLNEDEQPVVNVTVQEVFACLNQLSIEDGLQPVYDETNGLLAPKRPLRSGYRLPTEAEFAWALRAAGRGEAEPLRFSWGQELPPPDRFDNLADLSAKDILELTMTNVVDGYPVSAPVGSFTENAVGLYDMGGNVAEWVQDFYDPLATYDDEVDVDPLGPVTGRANVVRGPSWRSATRTRLRLSYREYDDNGREDIGFRIARNLE